jgi:hypothetical protein
MPYIKQAKREVLDPYIDSVVEAMKIIDAKDGDYNYFITRILLAGFELGSKPSYTKINTIVGILGCVETEINRRITGKYEDRKAFENEDVQEYAEFDKWLDDFTGR